jgi:hypothetical protein
MSKHSSLTETAKDGLTQICEWALHSPWLEWLARFGYAARGLVYMLVGALGVVAAIGAAEARLGIHGALRTIVRWPFGSVWLSLVGVGLAGYVLWRFIEAILDPEHKGTAAKGLVQRMAYVISGVVFAKLVFEAFELVIEWGSSPSMTVEDWTALVLAQPFGRWLVGSASGIVILGGLYQFYAAYTATFRDKFKWREMSYREAVWLLRLGRFGYAARGIVFLIIGSFLIFAALQAKAELAGGLSDALLALEGQPFGSWGLGGVALGLIAYGMYVVAEARYRRIRTL